MDRIDENRVNIHTPQTDVTLFANEDVYVDRASVEEITEFTKIYDTINRLKEVGYLSPGAGIERVCLTPDFHKGAGIPIGTVFASREMVIPKAVGSDIGCGMRFLQTDVTHIEFEALGSKLDEHIRYIFFEGGRNIALSASQRKAIFHHGLAGLSACRNNGEGIFEYWHDSQQVADLAYAHMHGGLDTPDIFNMDDFITGSGLEYTRDDQIGSIGGGNHFCEYQIVMDTYDRHKAYQWGLQKGNIAIMVHSGSVGIGHVVGNHFTDLARSLYPEGLKHEHSHYILSRKQDAFEDYLSAMANAANFAFANRLFLGLMMIRALSEALGRRVNATLVYDAPHNLIWQESRRGQALDHPFTVDTAYIHRKGACPAYHEMPVIIPGSMGSDSFLMVGEGLEDSFCSACHGAGRTKPRQQGRASQSEMTCRVVTKINPKHVRKDIRDDYMKSLMEEAPDKYKAIGPVIQTVEGAGIARRVARTFPLLTVKGL